MQASSIIVGLLLAWITVLIGFGIVEVLPEFSRQKQAWRHRRTKEPITVEPGTHDRQCAELIRERGFRHLPVVQDGKPIGIPSARDLQQYVVNELEAFIDQTRYRKEFAEGRDPYDRFGGGYSK